MAEMKPKTKTTIRDIAEEAGVSISLVSFVMNGKTRGQHRVNPETARRVREIAERMNYQPNSAAQTLRSGKTNTIGVILSDISNKFFADIARCIEDRASQYKYTVLFGSTDENPAKLNNLISVFRNKGVDGLIIVPCEGSEETVRKLIEAQMPVVLLDRTFDTLDVSSVILNNKKATAMAVNALLDQGYRKIELVSYETTTSNILDRELGYLQTMENSGNAEYAKVRRVKYKDLIPQLAVMIPKMVENGVEALIFVTNRLAIQSLKLLRDHNIRVPDDVAVIGFDGSETFAFELYYTGISYIRQPIEQFGYEALEWIMKIIKHKDKVNQATIVLNPELVLANSSRNPRK